MLQLDSIKYIYKEINQQQEKAAAFIDILSKHTDMPKNVATFRAVVKFCSTNRLLQRPMHIFTYYANYKSNDNAGVILQHTYFVE